MKLTEKSRQLRDRALFTAIPLCLLLFFFARWILTDPPESVPALIAAAGLAFLFAVCGMRFIPQWMAAWSTRPWQPVRVQEGRRSAHSARLHPFFRILFALIVFRVLLFVVAYLMVFERDGYLGGVFDRLDIWNMLGSDSRHYLNIAENWYVNTGDDRLLIVFFPLYPILVRLLAYVFQNYLVSGLFVSNVCCVFAGCLFYELALMDTDRRSALRALKYLCILPASFLLSAPLSDSLFLLLSVACVYCVRKDNYPLAGFVGLLAAFTRMPGVLLLAPASFELVGKIIRERPARRHDRRWVGRTVANALSLLLIPVGLLLYLYINYSVTGNATMFLTYQSAHWHQEAGWFFSSAATITDNAVARLADNRNMALGLWIPNLVALFASLGIVTAAQQKLRASNVAYFLAYYLVCMGATWLLSAPRYLTVCFPVALALGALTERKWADALATVVCVVLLLLYMYAYVNQWYVY